MTAMTKLGRETGLRYMREIACNPDLSFSDDTATDIYWNWFFEVSREGVTSWMEAVQGNDYYTMEAMVLDFQNNLCNGIKECLGNDVLYVEETPQWARRVFDIYMDVFGDYIGVTIPNFIQVAKRVLDGDAGDEGIDEL